MKQTYLDFTSLGYTPRDLLQLNRERFLAAYQQTFSPLFQIAQNMVIIALKQYRLYHSNDTASLAWLQVSLFTWLAIPV